MTRLRLLQGSAPESAGWDDGDDAAFALQIGELVRSADALPGEPSAIASREAALMAFARAASSSRLRPEPGRSLLGRSLAARRPLLWSAAAAAAITIAVAGGWSASSAGGPLYDARVAAEAFALPPAPAARERAQTDRLAARISDAGAAASAGDLAAVRASLEAFLRIAQEASPAAVPDADTAERLAAQLMVLADIPITNPDLVALRDQAHLAGQALVRAMLANGPGGGGGGGGVDPSGQPIPFATATPVATNAVGSGAPLTSGGAPAGTGASTSARPSQGGPSPVGPSAGSPDPSHTPASSGFGPSASPGASSSPGSGSGSPSPTGSGGPAATGRGGPGGG